MRSKIILLIRHCEAIQGKGRGGENWEHRPYIGRTDPSLTQTGIVEAGQLVERLTVTSFEIRGTLSHDQA
ncbi:MAG: Histidine phosphatase superfamily (branch 1) [Candidatus Kentron sp. G]|nr:MAG: Histidine phosphatase superfamily (branch 1) [Candidatus Kentron sp. G]VFN02069.1 MAG: Histidine phosphatase superfamily (branch 1) [Candidatus Kentron sp. G]VFN04641.1 MAG: Histidine phosphatase superfamily (branch 1) [Candidatus Kentron sp. G]